MEQSMRLPPGGAVTGWAGCRLHGAQFFDGIGPDGRTLQPVTLAVDKSGKNRSDGRAQVFYDAIAPGERTLRHGVPTLSAVRCVADAIRHASGLREAVIAADMMAAAQLVALDQIRHYSHTCRAGKRIRAALDLASEFSRSPNETRLRLMWVLDAGLRSPLVNCPVRDRAGRLLGIADLLDPESGLVVEFDGADHRSATQQSRDAAKDAALRHVGLEVVRVTGLDLLRPALVVNRLEEALARTDSEPASRRGWLAHPPTSDLHDRLVDQEQTRALQEAWESDDDLAS
jgi:Protein of unknown function (DUF559)